MKHKKKLNINQKYSPITKITTKEKASEYLETLIQYNMKESNHTYEEAKKIEKENIGYWTGYENDEIAKRIMELFECEHPILGQNRDPHFAFEKGKKLGEEFKKLNNDMKGI